MPRNTPIAPWPPVWLTFIDGCYPMTKPVRLFGIQIDPLTMSQTIEQLLDWSGNQTGNATTSSRQTSITRDVSVSRRLARGVRRSRLGPGRRLSGAGGGPLAAPCIPERVPGSDLVPALFETVNKRGRTKCRHRPMKVFLLGAAPGVAERAAESIHTRWPGVDVVGTHSPPLGFEKDAAKTKTSYARSPRPGRTY